MQKKKRNNLLTIYLLEFVLHDGPPYANGSLHLGESERFHFNE